LPENPEKYYFYFADSDKESEIYIPDGVKAVNLKNNEASVYVENEKADTTSINVVKKWLAADETEAYSPPYDEIEIVLYQTTTRIPSIIGNNPEESDACTAIGTYRLSENSIEKITELSGDYEIESTGSWSASIKGLPVVNNKGISYYYWVVEIEPDGYEASYSYDDEATFIQSGTITITNKPYMKYSLPETGSVGTMPIYLIGAAILIAAGLFDIKFKKSNIGNKVNKGSKKG
jgi:LPXTG-motif cell wall-anchored protein